MAANKFVGVRNGSIYVVSSSPIATSDPGVSVLPVPAEHQSMTKEEIITSFLPREGGLKPRRLRNGQARDMKLAFVGNWRMRCGISTYSENLLPHVAKAFGDYRLFIEKNDQPTGPINVVGDEVLSDERVASCWKRGESLQELAQALKEYDPDVIWFQHEFGIWPNASYWLALMSQLADFRVVVTVHSVFHHRDKTIVEAAMPEIIVHLDGAKRVLHEEKGLRMPVHVISHGCAPVVDTTRLWNFYRSPYTFMQFGFGYRYKGWERSIEAAAILKEKHKDVFFTGLFSESPFSKLDHQIYYDELQHQVDRLGLQDNVALIRGYQSDTALDSFMRVNQAVVFPYVSHPKHEVFGASGAARVAMSKVVPVVTSAGNHFSDLPTLKADTPEEIAAALESVLSSATNRKAQVARQLEYLNENTWEKVAAKHVALFESDPRE